ncbi:MAG: BatA domain-containing protein [Verrucomicrobia bacterium]|nr:BatA domain-containing protein [Verrucomicrobiota bacterium]
MTFLQPFILFGLPLILLPVIIHLINRMRHRPQQWAAMRFLISATRASTSHAKLRQFLILLFRTLAVLMLLLFLARPLAGGWMGWMLSPAPDVVLILLDRSASMEMQVSENTTKREQAIKLISEAAAQFQGASHLVLIDSALRTPQEIVNASALNGLSLAAPTDTAADIPAMLQAAFNYLVENRAGSAEIWIASDLQRSNWQPDDARFKSVISQFSGLPQRVRVRLLALNQTPENNLAIAIQDTVRRGKGDQSELQFVVDLQTSSESKDALPIQTVLDGASSETQVTMDSQSMRWRYKLDLGEKRDSGWGKFQLPSDLNAQDNTAYFAYGGNVKLRATIVSADRVSGKFFQIAAAAVANDKDAAQLLSPAEFGSANLEDRSLLIWQAPLPTGPEAERVQNFVEQGGGAIFFPSGNASSQTFAGVNWGKSETAEDEKGFHLVKWNEEEGPLAKTDEGFTLPLGQTEFQRRQQMRGQQAVLASFDDGEPFLTRQNLGKGQFYFCASLPDEEWSTLGDGPVLVPMIQRLLQAGSKRLQQVAFIHAGELSLADQQRQWTSLDSSTQKNARLDAGVYRSGDRLIAVNRPPGEDEPEILDVNEATSLFEGVSFQMLQDKQTQTDALQGEVWRFFLFGMLALLIGESFLILPGKPAAKQERPAPARKTEVAA